MMILNKVTGQRQHRFPTDEVILAAVVLFFVLMGSIIGWGARCVSTRDKVLIATVERHNAERDYYNGAYLKLQQEFAASNPAKNRSIVP